MGVFKGGATFLAVAAALLGMVSKLKPEIFLMVPNIGFILFSIAGGNGGRVPPYFDTTPFQDGRYREWLRDGDVVVAAAPKAGTHWMCYCADVVRRKGRDDVGLPYTDIMYTTPWMEMNQKPGMLWEERSALYNSTTFADGTKLRDYWDHRDFPFRIFKSHYLPKGSGEFDVLPVKEYPQVKFIAVVRNPFEVAKSAYSFFWKHNDEFRSMWGGFPPRAPDAETIMKDMLPGGNLYSFFFPYVLAWWPVRDSPNVLLLHYSDMIKDGPAVVEKLSSFLGVSLTAKEAGTVAEKCSKAAMEKNAHVFDVRLPAGAGGTAMVANSFIGKGEKGTDGLGSKAIEEFAAAIEAELLDPQMRQWALDGGVW